jgi:hypothetical protein
MIAKSEKTLIFAARQQQFCKNRVPDACGKGILMNWINQTNPFILFNNNETKTIPYFGFGSFDHVLLRSQEA